MGSNCYYQDEKQYSQVAIVMVPFPAQGHLNQLLQLSRLLSSYNILIHYVSTTIHIKQAKLRVHGWDPLTINNNNNNIIFHEFPTPPFQSPSPNPNATITNFPSHLQPLWEASSHLRDSVASLLQSLSTIFRRVIVVHDSLMGSVVQDVTSIPNAESYIFHSVSAFCVFWFFWETMDRPFAVEADMLKDLPSLEGCFSSEFAEFVAIQQQYLNTSSGKLYNTNRFIEGHYIDLLEKETIKGNVKQWAIGPFNPVSTYKKNNTSDVRNKCIEWLDKQAPKSVLLVSFGTTTSLTDEQINELAIGLEQSQAKFIWVLRDADKGDVFYGKVRRTDLPQGYEERVEGRGMVIRDWAPQLEILSHVSTGGFMSHCGWNSCMESISMGVPIAAWPMHSDQPRNCLLITKLLKIGIVVKDWARRNELVKSSTIEVTVKELMASKQGDEMRRRAEMLGVAVRKSVEDGGIARMELDSFIAHITR